MSNNRDNPQLSEDTTMGGTNKNKSTLNIADAEVAGDAIVTFGPRSGKHSNLTAQNYANDRRIFRSSITGTDRRSTADRRQNAAPHAKPERRTRRHFLRGSHRLLQLVILSGDLVTLVAVLLLSVPAMSFFGVRSSEIANYLALASWQFALVATYFLVTNWLRGNYTRKVSISDDLGELALMVFIAIGVQSTMAGLVGNRQVLLGLLSTWCLALPLISCSRLIVKRLLFRAGLWTRPAVIIGSGKNARRTAHALMSDWLLGFNIVEFVSYSDEASKQTGLRAQIKHQQQNEAIEILGHQVPIRHYESLNREVFSSLGNPHIVVAIDSLDFWQIVRLLYEADVPYANLTIVPSLRGVPLIGLETTHVFRHDVLILTVQNNLVRFIPRVLKRGFDIVASSILLFLMSPLLLLIAVLVAANGKNVIYGHERIGRRGESFKCYKFRSMVNDSAAVLEDLLMNDSAARAEWEKDFKLRNDPRVTRIGHFIRKTSLDELPQLINVLKGEMSLVGPRPVILEEFLRNSNVIKTGRIYTIWSDQA
jgi:undecaprenyl-phosphate galactose phosphotransferase